MTRKDLIHHALRRAGNGKDVEVRK